VQLCRASLPGKSAGQVCRASLPGKSAGQVFRASLPRHAGHVRSKFYGNFFPFSHFPTTYAKLRDYFCKITHFCTKISENDLSLLHRASGTIIEGLPLP
jgi:hypothetical protein